ncbi:MAG: Adenine specific DNA methyltransferase, partial [Candidatus Nomurabacteria bacterium GW2011_GWB1_40_7]
TDYVEFRFYRNGLRYDEPIKIANYDIKDRTITPVSENYEHVAKTLLDFTQSQKEPIRSGKHLSKIMGGRAQRIRDNVRQFLITQSDKNAELVRLYDTFKKLLVHDLTTDAFADMYAQTLVYGLFVARYNDETKKDLHFFDHIVGPNFDKRLEYIVNELCEIFSHADVQELMKEYFKDDLWGKTQKGPDPVIHFYEDFLKEYDPDLRKKMGAYYTPLPVVQFIVRSVDYLLEKEFGLMSGLADTSKTDDGIHKVQILDPAVGTGTFISDIIGKIYERILKRKQEGSWPGYVHHDLLPRLHGFELMMTPYTIAHLKLGMAFKKTGFKYFNQRLGIYLTNSLEKGVAQEGMFTGFGFAESIAEESKEASKIKNDKPIMVVIGNPPYSVSSSNKGKWIQDLIKVYKKDLGERKINLDDDYIKFIRFAEHFIEKNKTGIVAMITNNSFIDGITHRQMRKHLLETFDDIYILDLHGNSKKKEKTPDGGKDENVFDIQQGVSINIFIRKTKDKKNLGTVYHSEFFGKREIKFETLNDSDLDKIKWQKLDYSEPYYFFVPKDFGANKEYEKGFGLTELFPNYNSGIQTKNDDLTIAFDEQKIRKTVDDFLQNSLSELEQKYDVNDKGVWKASQAQTDLKIGDYRFSSLLYRPFDTRYTAITPRSSGFLARPRMKTSEHLLRPNLGLLFSRSIPEQRAFSEIFVSNQIIDLHAAAGQTYCAPLYLYPEEGENPQVGEAANIPVERISNISISIARSIAEEVGRAWYPVAEYPTKQGDVRLTPEDIFDYIYAVLHSPSYREKYKEFLKIDFPRVPYPKNKKQFERLVELGRELREIHLLESPKVSGLITTYPVSGSDTVEKISYENGNVYINSDQYFGNVPDVAWNFYIGGYQPAQKWLKDRKGRILTNEDIEHYQKIIIALIETDLIMKKIDKYIYV